jgi:hypothetical protein
MKYVVGFFLILSLMACSTDSLSANGVKTEAEACDQLNKSFGDSGLDASSGLTALNSGSLQSAEQALDDLIISIEDFSSQTHSAFEGTTFDSSLAAEVVQLSEKSVNSLNSFRTMLVFPNVITIDDWKSEIRTRGLVEKVTELMETVNSSFDELNDAKISLLAFCAEALVKSPQ